MTINKIQLSEFAVLAEQTAKAKALAAETKLRMDGEAAQLQTELADALFDPYVGKRIAGEYGKVYTLARAEHYIGKTMHLFAFDPSTVSATNKHGDRPRYSARGWTVSVVWSPTEQRMAASLTRESDGHPGSNKDHQKQGGTGDIGTQAVVLAQWLAREIGERLVLEKDGGSK